MEHQDEPIVGMIGVSLIIEDLVLCDIMCLVPMIGQLCIRLSEVLEIVLQIS